MVCTHGKHSHTRALPTAATLTTAIPTVAPLTMAALTLATLTTAIPTMAALTMAALTMAALTKAALTTATLTHLGRGGGRQLAGGDQRVPLLVRVRVRVRVMVRGRGSVSVRVRVRVSVRVRVALLAKDEARPARHAHPPRRHLVGQHAAVPRGCSQGGKQLARRAWLGFRVRVGVRVRVRVGAGARVRAGVRAAGRAAQQHRPPPRQDGAPRDLTQLRDRSCRHLRFQPPTFPGYHPMRGRAARGARPSRVAAACQ